MRKTAVFAMVAVSVGVVHAQSFTEGFENGPTGWNDASVSTFGNSSGGDDVALDSGVWHAQNESAPQGTTGWFNGAGNVFAPLSGNGKLSANFNNTTGTNTISNWFMSPELMFNNGDTISFFTQNPSTTFPDRLHLKLSTNGSSTDSADFTTTLLTVNPNLGPDYPTSWTQFSATISGLGGATAGRFAFHYDVTDGGPSGSNSNYIGIDDVAYEAVPEPATMTLLGLGALAALKKRKRK